MRTRAVAIASERSNAIGAVELECTPSGLVIVHRGVGAFQKDYAPGAVTTGTRVLVPWESVKEASFDGNRLFLHVDETLTPHHRLMLAGFSTGDPRIRVELRRQRLLVRVGTGSAMVVSGLLAGLTVARGSSETGGGAAVLLGFMGAGVVLAIGLVAEKRLGLGAVDQDGARLAFGVELSRYVPGVLRSLSPVDESAPPPEPPLQLPSFQALLPRSTTAVVITMSAAVLGAVLTASFVSRAPARMRAAEDDTDERRGAEPGRASPRQTAVPVATLAPATAQTAVLAPSAAPAAAAGAASSADTVQLSGACTCRRADSLLWRDGLPRLSTVLISRKPNQKHGHDHLEVELGVVNNWDQPIPEVRLLVQFYDKDPAPSTKRTPTFDRPLYFEGPLEPGQAIMWHAEARGNDFDVIAPPSTMLESDGSDAAPTNLAADLLRAIHRPIRLHGAMLLAFLGDPRAKEAALGLREALREDEAPYIDRLTWAMGDVRTCGIESAPTGNPRQVHACVFNASGSPKDGLGLKVRALDRGFSHDTPVEPPPLVVSEHTWKLGGPLAPGQGAIATVLLPTDNPDGLVAAAFEAVADQKEVLF